MVQLLWATAGQNLKKFNKGLLLILDIVLLDPNPRKIKTHVHTKTYSITIIAALFLIAKTGNNPNIHAEQMGEQNVIHKMKCQPAITRNELVIQHGLMNLSNVMLSERSQTQKITFILTNQKSRKQKSSCLELRVGACIGYKLIQGNILE